MLQFYLMQSDVLIRKNDIDYRIRYDEQNNSITIHAAHTGIFVEWSKTITNSLTESTSHTIQLTLTPKNLYNILCDYGRGRLSSKYKILFPCTSTNAVSSLSIEIHSTIEYHDEWDIKIITLELIDVPIETRLGTRLKQIETKFMTELKKSDETIDELFEENDMLFERNKKLRVSLEKAFDEIADLHNRFDKFDKVNKGSNTILCNRAADRGSLKLLKLLRKNGYSWNASTYFIAAKNGHLDILQYLHENGCPRPRTSFAIDMAVRNGHLEIVKYLHENGYSWNATACEKAVKNNHLDIVKYLHDNGCPCKHIVY